MQVDGALFATTEQDTVSIDPDTCTSPIWPTPKVTAKVVVLGLK